MADLAKVQTNEGSDAARRLLDAAARLYTDGSVYSVRSVAAAAGVNHGQVHHIFGGKAGMTRAMFEDLGRQLLERIDAKVTRREGPEFLHAAAASLIEDDRFARALARQVAESSASDSAATQQSFPVVDAMLAASDGLGAQARPLVAEGLARALGWALFSTWIRRATRLDDTSASEIESRLGGMPMGVDDGR